MKKILPICCCIIMLLLGGCQSQEPQEEAFIRDHAFSEEEESLLMTLPFDSEDRLLTYAVFDYSIPKTYHTVAFYVTAYKEGQIVWENSPLLTVVLSEDYSRKGKIGLFLDEKELKIQLWDDAEYGLGNKCDLTDLEINDVIRGSGMYPEESFDLEGRSDLFLYGFEKEDRLQWPETKEEYLQDAEYVLIVSAQIFK